MTRRPLTDPTVVVARRGGAWFIDGSSAAWRAPCRPSCWPTPTIRNRGSTAATPVQGSRVTSPSSSGTPPSCSGARDLAITLGALRAVAVLVLLVLLPGTQGLVPGYLAADLRLRAPRTVSGPGSDGPWSGPSPGSSTSSPGLPLVAYTSASLTRRHQRVGDLLARTYVVDKRTVGRPVDAPVDDDLTAEVLEPERLIEPVPEVVVAHRPRARGGAGTGCRAAARGRRRRRRNGPADGVPLDEPDLGPTAQALRALALRGRTLARARRHRLGPAGPGWRTRHRVGGTRQEG